MNIMDILNKLILCNVIKPKLMVLPIFEMIKKEKRK